MSSREIIYIAIQDFLPIAAAVLLLGGAGMLVKIHNRTFQPPHPKWHREFTGGYAVIFLLFLIAWGLILIGQPLPLEAATTFISLVLFALAFSVVLSICLLINAATLHRLFSKTWVKALDFFYISFAFLGLVKIVNAAPGMTNPITFFDAPAVILLAVALAIRLTKTILEVFFDEWINPPKK